MKAEINKWDGPKPKSFCTVKETINKMKRQATEWEKTFANGMSDKAVVLLSITLMEDNYSMD